MNENIAFTDLQRSGEGSPPAFFGLRKRPRGDGRTRQRIAFTLLEILLVIALIMILVALLAPGITSIGKAQRLTQAEQLITSQLVLARQIAVAQGQTIEVRFYRYQGASDTSPTFQAIQLIKWGTDGIQRPADRLHKLPAGVVLYDNTNARSTLLDAARIRTSDPAQNDPDLPEAKAGKYDVASFIFLPDGSTNLDVTGYWHVTAASTPIQNTLPANFITVQLDPLNGIPRVYRPR
jgi:uncharacterized protein (TIGR02596 family)